MLIIIVDKKWKRCAYIFGIPQLSEILLLHNFSHYAQNVCYNPSQAICIKKYRQIDLSWYEGYIEIKLK
jgi:hypothetical protein